MKNVDLESIINEFIEGQGRNLKNGIKDLFNYAKDKLFDLFDDDKDLEDALKIAWNYEEQNTSEYTMEDAVKWIKININRNVYSGACLFKEKTSLGLCLHLCFIDNNEEPLLGPADKHKVIFCNRIDESLAKQFGNKNLIIFK